MNAVYSVTFQVSFYLFQYLFIPTEMYVFFTFIFFCCHFVTNKLLFLFFYVSALPLHVCMSKNSNSFCPPEQISDAGVGH